MTTATHPADAAATTHDRKPEDVLTPRRLMWLRFRRHKLAVLGLVVTLLIYVVGGLAEFFSPLDPQRAAARYALHPPHDVHWFDETGWNPHVLPFQLRRDPETLKPSFAPDPQGQKVELGFFVPTDAPYALLGVLPLQTRFFGPKDPAHHVFLFGADRLGRDVLSRTIHASRISMSIGLVGVALSLFLGVAIGGLSGYYGGRTDWLLQRLTEFVIALPTIPIWMALAAALPKDWPPLWTYFMITAIVSLIGWTDLARVVRGKFLSLRNEDFVLAARIDGCSEWRIVFRQMLPSFSSHIIATVTLAIPLMILAETALSFLGLGLQPPTVSWGVLLKEVQNIRSIAAAPWLFLPGAAVVVAVLSLNFLGDGLRDAADPYSN